MVKIVEFKVAEDSQRLLFWTASNETGLLRLFFHSSGFLLKMRVIRLLKRVHLTRCHKNIRRRNTK
jgi:hypothetical protein